MLEFVIRKGYSCHISVQTYQADRCTLFSDIPTRKNHCTPLKICVPILKNGCLYQSLYVVVLPLKDGIFAYRLIFRSPISLQYQK